MRWQGPTSLARLWQQFPSGGKKKSVRDAYIERDWTICLSQMVLFVRIRLSYWGISPMNSSWSERFNGECNKSPRGGTEQNLMYTVIDRAGGCHEYQQEAGVMEEEINQHRHSFARNCNTLNSATTRSQCMMITRECQTVKTALLHWLNVIGDLLECDCRLWDSSTFYENHHEMLH